MLARALGTPEPRGRVRAKGQGVSPALFWDTPKPTKMKEKSKDIVSASAMRNEFEERLRQQEERHRQQEARLEERFRKQEEMLRSFMAQQSGSGSNIGVPPVVPTPPGPSYYVPDPQAPSYYVPDPPGPSCYVPDPPAPSYYQPEPPVPFVTEVISI